MGIVTFLRINKKKNIMETEEIKNRSEFDKALEELTEILGIKKPSVKYFPYMFNDIVVMGCGSVNEYTSDIPLSCYIYGMYMESTNTVMLATKCPFRKREMSEKDMIANLAHEMRHAWQYRYEREKYYTGKRVITGEEHIDDISEIDADAFSMAYTLFYKGFENRDIPQIIQYTYVKDNNARRDRARQLIEKYRFVA